MDETMNEKRFQKNDDGFVCLHCGKAVPPLEYSSRDHCPWCLYSRHVDRFPGDRANPCRGLLEPVSARPDAKKGFVIEYRCQVCGQTARCRAALGRGVTDDMEALIALTVNRQ